MKEHHLQLNLARQSFCLPCHSDSTAWFHHPARFHLQLPHQNSVRVRNLGVIFWWTADLHKTTLQKTVRSCRFALNNIRKIRPFLMEHAAQLLIQTLVKTRLDYCNALLVGLPSSTIKPLQMIHNAATRLSSTSQKEPMLHLSLSPCTGYRLQHASSSKHCLHIEQPQAQHPPTSTHWWQSTSPPEVWDPLVSDASLYLYI